ncbi:MAG TPA: hypothetical protein PK857_03195 [Hyphomicrobium sp.]|nr:hypothetical protein [Hyphomicrobium sp.]HRO48573.1 hypothetical protein [Hyphomicrobium sp.]
MQHVLRVAAFVALSVAASSAVQAYSQNVRKHCRADYMEYCSAHPVGSKGVRECMRSVGRDLRPACVNALAESGEVGGKAKPKRHRRAAGH